MLNRLINPIMWLNILKLLYICWKLKLNKISWGWSLGFAKCPQRISLTCSGCKYYDQVDLVFFCKAYQIQYLILRTIKLYTRMTTLPSYSLQIYTKRQEWKWSNKKEDKRMNICLSEHTILRDMMIGLEY